MSNKRSKKLSFAALLAALLFLSWASGDLAFFGSQQPSQSASSVVITAASAQGSVPSSPSVLSSPDSSVFSASLAASGSPPVIISASVEPEKVRPGDLMQISAQISDPSGVSSVSARVSGPSGVSCVSAYAGGIEAAFFISMAHYTGWWKHG